jgi:hypothetical protein
MRVALAFGCRSRIFSVRRSRDAGAVILGMQNLICDDSATPDDRHGGH